MSSMMSLFTDDITTTGDAGIAVCPLATADLRAIDDESAETSTATPNIANAEVVTRTGSDSIMTTEYQTAGLDGAGRLPRLRRVRSDYIATFLVQRC